MKNIFGRILPLAFMILGEIALYIFLFSYLTSKFVFVEVILHIAAWIVVLNIVRISKHLSSDIKWIFLILLFPVPGTMLYLITYFNLIINRTFKSIIKEEEKADTYFVQDESIVDEIVNKYPHYKSDFLFLLNSGFPIYKNVGYNYYSPGENGFKVMLEEMKMAKKYIFMEYFIIEEGEMFDAMLEILRQKANEGVKCRVMYDDMGSLNTLPASYAKKLEKEGIESISFNRITPILSTIMNNRDHRKLLIIDGEVAFTGGINLADEYINRKVKYGHWQDNVIRVKGPAVNSMLVTFLTNWNALRHEDDDYTLYYGKHTNIEEDDGYIIPYSETPLDFELTSQNVYMDILNRASEYVYIMTPYLIVDSEMLNCLIHTAKKGVDVRIILPGVADKIVVHMIGQSYYKQLIDAGVKIYEYTPGFVHSKVFISDDISCVVGTINLDYRSLYLHFENAVFLYDSSKVFDVKYDFIKTLNKCKRINEDEAEFSLVKTILVGALRIFASLM